MKEETLELIYSRHSCRNFLLEPLQEEDIEILQKAVECAPSYNNEQPWFFVFIQNQEIIHQLEQLAIPEGCAYNAPLLVIGFGNYYAHSPVMDTTLAFANMQYAALSRNLGTCFVQFPVDICNAKEYKELSSALGVPDEYMCVGALAIGKQAKEEKSSLERKTNVFSMVY